MAIGVDKWSGAGNVATDVHYSETTKGERACSFKLAIDKPHKPTTFVRINVWGDHVSIIKKRKLGKGDFCVVAGELMNRDGKSDTLTEIRCEEISIPSVTKQESEDRYE